VKWPPVWELVENLQSTSGVVSPVEFCTEGSEVIGFERGKLKNLNC
jgi:hypothetical protein